MSERVKSEGTIKAAEFMERLQHMIESDQLVDSKKEVQQEIRWFIGRNTLELKRELEKLFKI